MTAATAPKPKRPTPPGGARNRPVRVPVAAAGGLALSPQEEGFAVALAAGVGRTAALRATLPEYATWKAESQHAKASEIAARPAVVARVAQLRDQAALTNNVAASDLVAIHMNRIKADPRELSTHDRRCCRCCWGKGHGFQRTIEELRADRQRHADQEHARLLKDLSPGPAFDVEGGSGFDPSAPPNASCPECRGVGVLRTTISDMSKLTPEALALFNGIRETKDGVQVLLADKDASLTAVGRHTGFFTEDNEVTVTIAADNEAAHQKYLEAMAEALQGKVDGQERKRLLDSLG